MTADQGNERNEQARENARTLESEIDKLAAGHWSMLRRSYTEFWEHARQIQDLFKTTKPLVPADRERLWRKYGAECEKVKAEQEETRRRRAAESKEKRELIQGKLDDAENYADGAESHEDLEKARSLLDEACRWMKDGWSEFSAATDFVKSLTGSEGRLSREDRDECWARVREIRNAIHFKREELWEQSYEELKRRAWQAVEEAGAGDPREAKAQVKDIQRELKATYLKKIQGDEIRDILNDAWEKASSRLRERHEQWKERQQGHLERWAALIEKNEAIISSLEEQIADCEEREADARTEEFAATVRGWIEEKLDKINAIRETNRDLEEKIASVQAELDS